MHTHLLRETAGVKLSSSGETHHNECAPKHTHPSFTLEAGFNSTLSVLVQFKTHMKSQVIRIDHVSSAIAPQPN